MCNKYMEKKRGGITRVELPSYRDIEREREREREREVVMVSRKGH